MAKGENIFKRKDGRWEARYVKGHELSGKIKYGFCYGKTYKEAKEKVTKCKAALVSGQPLPKSNSKHRFTFYCDEWFSQERLALNAGITPAYLGLLEREKRNATVSTIERICSALNLSLAEFFSVAHTEKEEDKICNQFLCQLIGLSDEEKMLTLQIIKNTLDLRQIYMQNKTDLI